MNDATLLYRQIHPNFVQAGLPTRQAFCTFGGPIPHLSVYDGDMIEAEASHVHYTQVLNKASIGAVAITPAECNEVGLPAISSPEVFAEHAHVDFTGITGANLRAKSQLLLNKAIARNWQYQIEP